VRGQPNEQLRTVLVEAGLSNKAFARAVRAAAATQDEMEACDHTKVSRWLAGGQPRAGTARFICQALSRRLGRPVTPEDIGLLQRPAVDPGLGLVYPDTHEAAMSALADLWHADLDDGLRSAAVNAGAWSEASLAWLVRPGRDEYGMRASGRAVGLIDVAAVRTTTETFATLDNQFGGDHARRALIEFLRTDLAPLLRGSYSESVGRQLFAAAAEATLLAAWMSYDAGRHGIAQRYFIHALRLAQTSDDVLLASTILDAMSHQATFLGRFREAAFLTRAAASGTTGRATPTLQAHFLAMEARAHAAAGDRAGTERALADAVRLFERRDSGDDPPWIYYVDDHELAAEFAHCHRDLGQGDKAIHYAELALAHDVSSPRSDYFVTMVLAAGHLAAGDVEAACDVAFTATTLGGALKSARAVEYLRQFKTKLEPFKSTAAVARLEEQFIIARTA
jgi:tetratricopeptide (TPR) repeat protein